MCVQYVLRVPASCFYIDRVSKMRLFLLQPVGARTCKLVSIGQSNVFLDGRDLTRLQCEDRPRK